MKAAKLIFPERCPHCGVSRPVMSNLTRHITAAHDNTNMRQWVFYSCSSCGGVTMAVTPNQPNAPNDVEITEMWPAEKIVSDAIPKRAQAYLTQAFASGNAPAGAIMLTGSAIDSMLKDKGYRDGSLYARIEAAANDHLITHEMALWAHEVRLDANDQRHADEQADLPSDEDAKRVLEFAAALGEFLYVLPATIIRGRKIPAPTEPA